MEKLEKLYLGQVKVNTTVTNPVDNMHPWYNVMKMAVNFGGFSHQIQELQCDHEQNIRQIQDWGPYYKIPNQYFSKPSRS